LAKNIKIITSVPGLDTDQFSETFLKIWWVAKGECNSAKPKTIAGYTTPGFADFSWRNLPNGHKISQMASKYTK
jgi:hypothetical protein